MHSTSGLHPVRAAVNMRRSGSVRGKAGFTLIELVIVAGIIMLVMSMALPAMMPALAYSELDGAARHVANYGRSAAAYASFEGEYIMVKVDMDQKTYWSVKVLDTNPALFETEESETAFDEQAAIANQIALQAENPAAGVTEEALQLEERMERFFRRAVEAQAKNVKHDGIFAGVQPLFEEDFRLRDEEDEEEDEVKDHLLRRTTLPDGVVFESMTVGAVEHFTGIVEIEVSPLGLAETITFYLRRGEDEYFTVVWDPITGGSRIRRGKESSAEAEAA